MFDNSKDAKTAGWFSRRHETADAHMEVRQTRREKLEIRRMEALERENARARRTDEQQLEILKQRGVTEGREVDRLKARIES